MSAYLTDPDVTLHHADACEVMAKMEPESVDCVVTSPPYADLRSYGGSSPERYGEWITPFLVAMLRVATPRGALVLNVGRVHRGGVEIGIAEDARRAAQAVSWLWIDSIVWHKTNAFYGGRRTYLHNVHEHVWWLARSGDAYRGYDDTTRTPHSPSTLAKYAAGFRTNRSKNGGRYYQPRKIVSTPSISGACPKSVVAFAVASPRGITHSATMALGLARHLVCLACPPGGLVLDPFAGSGTTLLAARNTGRRAVGIEQSADYCAEATHRLRQLSLLAPPQTGVIEA